MLVYYTVPVSLRLLIECTKSSSCFSESMSSSDSSVDSFWPESSLLCRDSKSNQQVTNNNIAVIITYKLTCHHLF